MGILDDAIREHLDLKRRQGAAEEELARLEDEAFGPPTRPGDVEVAEQTQHAGAPQGEVATGEQESLAEAAAFHDQTAGEPSPENGRGAGLGAIPAVDAERDEPGAETPMPELDERLAILGEPTVEHDTLAEGEEAEGVELDIELDLDEEIEEVSELDVDEAEITEAVEAGPEPAAEEPAEEPIESLDTVEHHFEDALDEAEVVDDEAETAPEESGEQDEDVLEETPEFLRDAPEDDELWFEQGEPKDFDF